MSDTLLGALIGGGFAFFGVLIGLAANAWFEAQKSKRERLREVRLRLVGGSIQTSEGW